MTTPNGTTTLELRQMAALLAAANLALADARCVLAGSAPSGAIDAVRKNLEAACVAVESSALIVRHALAPRPWCNLCGDGAPGEIVRAEGSKQPVPCPLCRGAKEPVREVKP